MLSIRAGDGERERVQEGRSAGLRARLFRPERHRSGFRGCYSVCRISLSFLLPASLLSIRYQLKRFQAHTLFTY